MMKHTLFLLKYALKELRNNLFFASFFTLTLWLGLIGFVLIGNIKNGVNEYFDHNLQKILNADVQLSSRQILPENIGTNLNEFLNTKNVSFESSEVLALFSMVNAEAQNALFNITAIDESFNLYSDFSLEIGAVTKNIILQELMPAPFVWLDESGMELLQLNIGDSVNIGKTRFVVNQKITNMPQLGSAFSAFVPTVYIHKKHLKDTGLLALGSRAFATINIKLSNNAITAPALKQEITDWLIKNYPDNNNIRVRDTKDASERLQILFDYLSGFLSLVSLIGLFLSAIGSVFLFRHYALRVFKNSTIAVCLGMLAKDTRIIVLAQLILLALFASILAIVFGAILSYALNFYLADITHQIPLFHLSTALEALLIGVLSAVLFSLPTYLSAKNIKPIILLKNDNNTSSFDYKKQWFLYLPGVSFFWLLSVYLTSWIQGSLFVIMLGIIVLLLALLMRFMCMLSLKMSKRFHGTYKIALRNIAYHQNSTISSSVALSVGVFLIIIITQVAYGVRDEIKQPQGSMLPSYFLIDIQPEQLTGLQELIKSNNLKLEYLSPLIRARLTNVNGEAVGNRHSAESVENRGRFRAFNLSYRTGLFPSETIIEGQALSSEYDNTLPAEISVEEKFALRNNLNIGDNLVFDIQGIEIGVVIKNLRRVAWNSFQPNFFVLFQPQALELAPKTYIANISNIVAEQKTIFKRTLANNYSNISAVDIQKLITTVLDISTKALQLILLLAFLVVLSGFMVVFSIAVMRSYDKKGELALFKTLGLSMKELRHLNIIELTLPVIIALILGAILGILASFAISYVVFGSIFNVYLEVVILVSIIALLLIALLSWFIGDYVSKVKVMFNLEQQN